MLKSGFDYSYCSMLLFRSIVVTSGFAAGFETCNEPQQFYRKSP